jgi:hypothetical protein
MKKFLATSLLTLTLAMGLSFAGVNDKAQVAFCQNDRLESLTITEDLQTGSFDGVLVSLQRGTIAMKCDRGTNNIFWNCIQPKSYTYKFRSVIYTADSVTVVAKAGFIRGVWRNITAPMTCSLF